MEPVIKRVSLKDLDAAYHDLVETSLILHCKNYSADPPLTKDEWLLDLIGKDLYQELGIQSTWDGTEYTWQFRVRGYGKIGAKAILKALEGSKATLTICRADPYRSELSVGQKGDDKEVIAKYTLADLRRESLIEHIFKYNATAAAWDRAILNSEVTARQLDRLMTRMGFVHEWMENIHIELYQWQIGDKFYYVETEDLGIRTFGVSFLELPVLTGETIMISPQSAIIRQFRAHNNNDLAKISKRLVVAEKVWVSGFVRIEIPLVDPIYIETGEIDTAIEYSFFRPIDRVARLVCIS